MKTFEEFKASRERMEPSAKKLSDYQWEQAYAAYRSSRERVRGSRSSREGAHAEGRAESSERLAAGQLRTQVRKHSAYADLRVLINVCAWILIALFVLLVLGQAATLRSGLFFFLGLAQAAIGVVSVLVIKAVLHVLIDIPDIALFQASRQDKRSVSSEESAPKDE